MRPHGDRLTRLEQAQRTGRIARMTDAELDARIAVLLAKAGIEDSASGRAAALAQLRAENRS